MMNVCCYAEACDRNRDPIFEVIEPLLRHRRAVLEIGSGTGQHAIYFAKKIPHLVWHTSDREENHPAIQGWLDKAGLPNVLPPQSLDVSQPDWPAPDIDTVFSANTAHIMGWHEVELFFSGVGRLLPDGGILLLYGPFNYSNQFTSESNRVFDQRLRERDPDSGIRDFERLDQLAQREQMVLRNDFQMPANNRLLFWQKALP